NLFLLSLRAAGDGPISLALQEKQLEQSLNVIDQPLFRHAVQAADGQDEFAPRPLLGEPGTICQIGDAGADCAFRFDTTAALQAIELGLATLWLQYAGQHTEQRAFADAIRTNSRDQFAGVDREIDAPQHRPHAVMLRHVDEPNHATRFLKDLPPTFSRR